MRHDKPRPLTRLGKIGDQVDRARVPTPISACASIQAMRTGTFLRRQPGLQKRRLLDRLTLAWA
jgi:hypothetical protein